MSETVPMNEAGTYVVRKESAGIQFEPAEVERWNGTHRGERAPLTTTEDPDIVDFEEEGPSRLVLERVLHNQCPTERKFLCLHIKDLPLLLIRLSKVQLILGGQHTSSKMVILAVFKG